ncbi:ABC transporter ATP-binding protein [bacterium]|nr:ABC transporter ATP-binding protein [bacterium]
MNLQVAGIDFSYNHIPILKEVSFDLAPGKILGIMGINGAGKSTLLKCLNRILKLQTGAVFVDETDLRKMSGNEIAQRFGYVPQKHDVGSLTVFDAVLLGRKPYMKWSASRHDLMIVADVLKRLGFEHLAQRPVNRLSGGEYQKVIIARALAQEPDVLLLDEPTSNLDLKNQLQVMELVQQVVHDSDMSAIVSLHDINLALRYVDDLLMLKDGVIHFLSPKKEVTAAVIEEIFGVRVMLGEINSYQIIIPINLK